MIYLDNAATTRMKSEVLDAMLPYMVNDYANPATEYDFANGPRQAVERARVTLADLINAAPEEIVFTSGGAESDTLAIQTVAYGLRDKGRHIITTKIEHRAVLDYCAFLEKDGFQVTYLPVDSQGLVDLDALRAAIRPDTILILVMMANNEIGTIEPIKQIGVIAREHGIAFHTDAVQTFGHMNIDVRDLGVDFLSVSAHKFGGPKGVGFLYAHQFEVHRPGTLNVPGIVGMAYAAELAYKQIEHKTGVEDTVPRIQNMRDHLVENIMLRLDGVRFNGASLNSMPHSGTCCNGTQINGKQSVDVATLRLYNNANLSFVGIDAEGLLTLLNGDGIYASAGSACNTGNLEPSHVLSAIGVPDEYIHGTIRMTLSSDNTMEEMDYVADRIVEHVTSLRRLTCGC